MTEKNTTVVDVDGKNADDMLKKLTESAKGYAKAMGDAIKANDLESWKKAKSEMDKVNKEITKMKKEAFDVTKVLKNLNGTNLGDLERAKKSLVKQMLKLDQGTQDYIAHTKDLSQVTAQISKVKGEMFGVIKQTGAMGGAWNTFKGVLAGGAALFGVGQAIDIVKKGFKDLINSTQTTGDAWARNVEGMKFAYDKLLTSFASGEGWKNLLSNMKEAYKAGKEYADMLDGLFEKTNAYTIARAKATVEFEKLERITKDATRSEQERYEATKRIKELEFSMYGEDKKIKEDAYNAELIRIKSKTGLEKEEFEAFTENYNNQAEIREKAIALIKVEQDQKSLLANQEVLSEEQYNAAKVMLAEYEASLGSNLETIRTYAEIYKGYEKGTDEIIQGAIKARGDLIGTESEYLQITEKNSIREAKLKDDIAKANEERNTKEAEAIPNLLAIQMKYLEDLSNNALNEKAKIAADLDAIDAEAFEKSQADADAKYEEDLVKLAEFKEEQKAILLEYGLITLEQLEEQELAFITTAHETGLLNEDMFKAAKEAVAEKYRVMGLTNEKKTADEEKKIQQEKFQAFSQYAQQYGSAALQITSALSNMYEASKQRELKAAGDNAKKKEAIEKKYAKKQQKIALVQAIINTALGVTQALGQGGILGIIMGILVAAAGAIEIATISSQEFAQGLYPVIGKQTNDTMPMLARGIREFTANQPTHRALVYTAKQGPKWLSTRPRSAIYK